MQNLTVLDTNTLLELLITQTEVYKQLEISGHNVPDFNACKEYIDRLHTEIASRKAAASITDDKNSNLLSLL